MDEILLRFSLISSKVPGFDLIPLQILFNPSLPILVPPLNNEKIKLKNLLKFKSNTLSFLRLWSESPIATKPFSYIFQHYPNN